MLTDLKLYKYSKFMHHKNMVKTKTLRTIDGAGNRNRNSTTPRLINMG